MNEQWCSENKYENMKISLQIIEHKSAKTITKQLICEGIQIRIHNMTLNSINKIKTFTYNKKDLA
jgi:hypothetical protein